MKKNRFWMASIPVVAMMSLGLLATACDNDNGDDNDLFDEVEDTEDPVDGNGNGADDGEGFGMEIDGLPGGVTAVYTMAGGDGA